MTIGVIITVYNLEKYVAEAIQSVLDQSLKPDRIIVVDDGSVDRSREVVGQFASSVQILANKKNQGVLASCIRAIRELSDMDLISFLDGDDRWRKDKLERVHEVFRREPDIMLATHSYQWMDSDGKTLSVEDDTLKNLKLVVKASGNDASVQDRLLKNSILSYKGVWLGSAMVVRTPFLPINDFDAWSQSLRGHALSHQDQPLAAYLILKNPSKKIQYIDTVLFDYRVYGENSSGNSQTIDKALFTLSRSEATLLRTCALVKQMDRPEELRVQENKLKEVAYWQNLYRGRLITSFGNYIFLLGNFWSVKQGMKELVRWITFAALGPSRFLRIKLWYLKRSLR